MLPDAFDDLGLLGKQKVGPVVSGSHCFEIRGFKVVVEDSRKQWRDCLEHFGTGGTVVGSEQGIQKPFEFLLIEDLESIHLIVAEVTVHGASE